MVREVEDGSKIEKITRTRGGVMSGWEGGGGGKGRERERSNKKKVGYEMKTGQP